MLSKLKIRINSVSNLQWMIITAVLVLVGFSASVLQPKPQTEAFNTAPVVQEPQVRSDISELLPENLDSLKSVSDIQTLAASKNKEIAGIQLSYQDGILVYTVIFADDSKQSYDAKTGLELDYNGDGKTGIESADRLPPNYNPSVSFADALKTAKTQHPDIPAKIMELDVEASIVRYSVFFEGDKLVYVSTSTGDIVKLPTSDPIKPQTTTTAQSNTSTSTKKKNDWRDNWKKIRNDNRQKLEDYYDRYINRN